MKTHLGTSGLLLYKKGMTANDIKELTSDLKVAPIITFDTANQQDLSFNIYRENSTRYRIPRFYGLSKYGTPDNIDEFKHTNIDVSFTGTLNVKTLQDIAVAKTIETMQSKGGGILSLPPGYGKTTCALYVLCQMKVKTLIIVHKEFLMNQWIERINQFIPDARIGIIRQNKVDIDGKDIVIGMLQSLAMKDYSTSIFDSFGLTIIDETHHICSNVFSRAFFKFSTPYYLGLSATPYRKDGLTKVLEWFIGPVFYSVERENQTGVSVEACRFKHDSFKNPLPTNRAGKVSCVDIITNLVNLPERNAKILERVIFLYNQGRNVMILSDRREHCFNLKLMIEERLNTHDVCGLYMGGMKQGELNNSESKQIIIATYSLAHEGLDIPKLDSLILATPKSDVVQACGRILRETKGKKHNPYIIDIVDSIGLFINQYRKRKQFYAKSGFNVLKNECEVEKASGFMFISDE
jgi:superfamily II DNA or RNA helicase